jgi:uncharacterized repeat protein (TIGR03803 family)
MDTRGKERVLYRFTDGADGGFPMSALIRDSENNLYGSTYQGGTYQGGTVFKLEAAGKETVLHSFSGQADGRYPVGSLIRDAAGNIFGTANLGGDLTGCFGNGCGAVFKVNSVGAEDSLYTFSGAGDGATPYGGVISDKAGNLYGTTWKGGTYDYGTVFKLDKHGTLTVLYSFSGGTDGAYPLAGLIRDAAGNLYGTTQQGGSAAQGTVFELTFP